MTNTKLFLLIGTSLSLIPCFTSAQCVATQDCATLGYTETSCSGGTGVKCPFGNKWACFKTDAEYEQEFCTKYGFTQTCTGSNQTGGAGQSCQGKYNYCACASGYEWRDGGCKTCSVPCTIGTLYYSDGTCYDELEESKTLLGVVIYEKSATESGWIMTVKPIRNGTAWDTIGYTYSTGIRDTTISASCTNTQKLVALGSRFTAANLANNYKPTGTPSGKSWCLPSYDLLNNLNNSTNFAKVNAGITTAGGSTLGFISRNYENIWSSSEYSSDYVWFLHANMDDSGYMESYKKTSISSYYSIRPVMAF